MCTIFADGQQSADIVIGIGELVAYPCKLLKLGGNSAAVISGEIAGEAAAVLCCIDLAIAVKGPVICMLPSETCSGRPLAAFLAMVNLPAVVSRQKYGGVSLIYPE
jgi:hypothetical protein